MAMTEVAPLGKDGLMVASVARLLERAAYCKVQLLSLSVLFYPTEYNARCEGVPLGLSSPQWL